MEAQTYHGYQIWGHAILQQDEILQPERFAASGTITQNNKLVEASGVLGVFDTEDDAREAGPNGPRLDRQPPLSQRRPHSAHEKGRHGRPFPRRPRTTQAAGRGGRIAVCGRPTSRASPTIVASVARYATIWIPAGRAV